LKHLVFFASGSGTNFQAVIDTIHNGSAPVRIRGLITNKWDIGALERAKEYAIPAKVIAPSSFSSVEKYETTLHDALQLWQPDLIVLAGYLLKIPASIVQKYSGRIINIHPSLLPKFGGKDFYGIKVHKAVIKAGEIKSGCSVHIVDEEYDRGPLLAQHTVPVHNTDTPETLAKRVLEEEHKLLPKAILDYFSDSE
jgi:formyltetrahydrofolate-dependent phosphoribosylglycinamide formyltransferase